MDKRTILLPVARQIKHALMAGGLCLLLGACATNGQNRAQEDADQSSSTDSQASFHIATAERLVDVGEYESALEEYLAAALASSDPQIAQMVTRLAARLENWSTAILAAERWIDLDQDADSAYHVGIIARVNLGRPEQAASELAGWLDRQSDAAAPRWWRRAAMLLAATNNDQMAGEVFDRLVDDRGESAPAGEIEHAESILLWRQERADESLQRALSAAESSGDPEHLVWAAQLAVDGQDLEQALALYRRARAGDPDDVTTALAEAEVLRQLERDEAALELLESLPADSETLYTLGTYLIRMERDARADEIWQALRDLPQEQRREAHPFLVAQLAELVGRDEAALTWYERVSDLSRLEQSKLRRAAILGRLGRIEASRTILAELRESGDESLALDSLLIEAELLRMDGRAGESVELLGLPLAENPGNTELLYARALSAASAGNVDLAEQDLRRIIQLDGGNAMALNALGYTLTDLTDRHQEAYRLIRRALELDPDDPATLDSMGWVLYRLGRSEEAVDYLRRALAGDENPEIMTHLIEVLDHLGRSDEADELAERAFAAYPEDDYLRTTLERLERLP